jgi:hypothetical protein
VLPLGLFPSPIGGDRLVNQARELLFGCILGSACNHKLSLKEGGSLNCLISFYMSRSPHDDPPLGYPLSPGGPSPHHNGGHLRPSHFLLKLHHLSHVPGQALCKKVTRGRKSGNPERARET